MIPGIKPENPGDIVESRGGFQPLVKGCVLRETPTEEIEDPETREQVHRLIRGVDRVRSLLGAPLLSLPYFVCTGGVGGPAG